MLTKNTTFVYYAYLCCRFNRGIFPRCLNFTIMLSNEFVRVTCVYPHRRSHMCLYAGFNQCRATASDILSDIIQASREQYQESPFVTGQVITDGAIDFCSYFVSLPRRSGIRYVIRYEVINDLPH